MPKISLDRRFFEWKGKGQGDPEIYQYVAQSYGYLDWPALLKRRHVVILANSRGRELPKSRLPFTHLGDGPGESVIGYCSYH